MSTKIHSCITLACDVCGERYEPCDFEMHSGNIDEAIRTTRDDGWTVIADGRAVCDNGAADHQAAIAALLPPEPGLQIAGQLRLDGTEEPA